MWRVLAQWLQARRAARPRAAARPASCQAAVCLRPCSPAPDPFHVSAFIIAGILLRLVRAAGRARAPPAHRWETPGPLALPCPVNGPCAAGGGRGGRARGGRGGGRGCGSGGRRGRPRARRAGRAAARQRGRPGGAGGRARGGGAGRPLCGAAAAAPGGRLRRPGRRERPPRSRRAAAGARGRAPAAVRAAACSAGSVCRWSESRLGFARAVRIVRVRGARPERGPGRAGAALRRPARRPPHSVGRRTARALGGGPRARPAARCPRPAARAVTSGAARRRRCWAPGCRPTRTARAGRTPCSRSAARCTRRAPR